jgi:hypothetical protein
MAAGLACIPLAFAVAFILPSSKWLSTLGVLETGAALILSGLAWAIHSGKSWAQRIHELAVWVKEHLLYIFGFLFLAILVNYFMALSKPEPESQHSEIAQNAPQTSPAAVNAPTRAAKQEPTAEEIRQQEEKEREEIESKTYSISFTYDDPPAFIRIPAGGYRMAYEVEDCKAIAIQGSGTENAPAWDTPRDQLIIDTSNKKRATRIMNWFRPIAWDDQQGLIRFKYHFVKRRPML